MRSTNLSHTFLKSNSKEVITAQPAPLHSYFRETWKYRKMIATIVLRDIKVKYSQTFLGILWALIQPITGMVIFSLFFTNIFNLQFLGIHIPYYLFAFSGLASWIFFTNILMAAGNSLVQEEPLIKRVYFPKIILPVAKMITGMVDLSMTILLLFIIMFASGYFFSAGILLLPFIIFLNAICGLALAIWLSALTIRFRDFHHIIPYIVGFGIWLTPVFYPVTIIPEHLRFLIYFNPMAGIVDLFRWSIFGTPLPGAYFIFSFIAVIIILISGMFYFRKIEAIIADYL